jgi:proteasome lid subunit RPN8/RPN11
MSLNLAEAVLAAIHAHGEQAYPDEGAGLLLGREEEEGRCVVEIYPLDNSRENEARHNRYLITPQDMLQGELEATRRGLDVVGVFHSHPDHPNRPSEFDRDWALPWYSYIITSVQAGKAIESRSWRLLEDRSLFVEEDIQVVAQVVKSKKAE